MEEYCLSLAFKDMGFTQCGHRYVYQSLRRALQAKKEYQRYWNRVMPAALPQVRIEHYYTRKQLTPLST